MGTGERPRLLSTLYLYRSGYDFKRLFTISEYYDRDRPAYYRALQSTREQNLDLTGLAGTLHGGARNAIRRDWVFGINGPENRVKVTPFLHNACKLL